MTVQFVTEGKIFHVSSFTFISCLLLCFDSFSSSVSSISTSSSILSLFFNFIIMVMYFPHYTPSTTFSFMLSCFVDSCKYLSCIQNFQSVFLLPFKFQQHFSCILGLHSLFCRGKKNNLSSGSSTMSHTFGIQKFKTILLQTKHPIQIPSSTDFFHFGFSV